MAREVEKHSLFNKNILREIFALLIHSNSPPFTSCTALRYDLSLPLFGAAGSVSSSTETQPPMSRSSERSIFKCRVPSHTYLCD